MPEEEHESHTTTEHGGKGNIVTRKLGPLPVWAWVVVGATIIGILYIATKPKKDVTPQAVGTQLPPTTDANTQAALDMLLAWLQQHSNDLQNNNLPCPPSFHKDPTTNLCVPDAVGITPPPPGEHQQGVGNLPGPGYHGKPPPPPPG